MSGFSDIINKLGIIKQIPVFSKLNWFELHMIASKAQFVEYKKGDIVCAQGDSSDGFYCLVTGRLQAYTVRSSDNKRERVEFLQRGMYFGIISLLTGENHSMTFEAINDSVVLRVDKNDFDAILRMIPRLAVDFSTSLSRRLRSRVLQTKSIFESTIISIYSPVKGSGSSTYAMNLALALERESGKNVLYVNIGSLAHEKNLSPSAVDGVSPFWKKAPVLLKDIIESHEKIVECIIKKELKIDLLDVIFDPQNLNLISQMSRFVSSLAVDYHYVVVDLPSEADDIVLKTLTQSDAVHLLMANPQKDMDPVDQVIVRMKDILGANFRPESIEILINNVKPDDSVTFEETTSTMERNVYTGLAHISLQELTVTLDSEHVKIFLPASDGEYARAITRIARRLSGVLVGLVLGGGAALGLAHIGVLRVLEKEKIPIDILAGSSMGALIASLWACGKTADEIEKIARQFRTKLRAMELLDFVWPRSGFINGENIRRWLKKQLKESTFRNAKIPLKVVAYDLNRREELVIDKGLLVDALRQSIAIPGLVSPVMHEGRLIIDGGIMNPLPANVLRGLGIKKIIAVNVLQSPMDMLENFKIEENRLKKEKEVVFFKMPLRYLGIRFGRLWLKLFCPSIFDIIVSSFQAAGYVISEQNAQQTDVVIHPNLAGLSWFELYQVDELIKRGEAAARVQLPAIRQLMSEP